LHPDVKDDSVELPRALLSDFPIDVITVLLKSVDPRLEVRIVKLKVRELVWRALLGLEEALTALGRATFHHKGLNVLRLHH
jgi:hypothetical protein